MRQLVSVVTETHVNYFVQDGDDVQQIAQLVNPGLTVPAVIELGTQLQTALSLNAPKRSPRALPAAETPKGSSVPTPPARAAQASTERVNVPRLPADTTERSLRFIFDHPGCVSNDVAAALGLAADDRKALDALQTRLWQWAKRGEIRSVEIDGTSVTGNAIKRRAYYPLDEPEQIEQPELLQAVG